MTTFKRQTHACWQTISRFLDIHYDNVSAAEKLVATFGGMLGIFLIALISFQFTGATGAALVVPSMGASAVLLFAVPHGRLSQPWPLIGGNLISAVVGVTCYQMIPDPFIAASLAVGFAIAVMHILACVHPPGGATALAAVIGGPAINDLGYAYVITPILLNTMVIFLVAFIFNNFFPWRRYPVAAMMRFTDTPAQAGSQSKSFIDKDTVKQALADMDLIVDITADDLQRLVKLTLMHAENRQLTSQQIQIGHYYTNAKHGPEWSVRQIIDESYSEDPSRDMVIYRVAEGQGLRSADSCTRSEFARWAAREVFSTSEK